jgi:hypothetical protein
VLLPAAVIGPAGQLTAQAVRDSAGIQVVSSERPMLPAARAWRIDERPVLRIGGDDAPPDTVYEFALIMGVSRMSDGRWAVGVQGAHTVRFFDAAGKFVGSAGRQGQGPGEFRQILGMTGMPGDTIVVTDNREIEYFDGRGRFIRQGASQRTMGDFGYVWPAAMLPGGSYVGFNLDQRVVPPPGRVTRTLPLVRVSSAGARIDSMGVVPINTEIFDGRQPYGTRLMFGPTSSLATAGERIWFGFPDRYEVRELDQSGRLVRLARRAFTPTPVREAERRTVTEFRLETAGRDRLHPMTTAIKERIASTPFAETYPAFGELKTDRSGNLWVQHYDWHSTLIEAGPSRVQTMSVASQWDVFDPAGRWLCSVTLPARFTPLEIGNDYVAGIARDDDDVERVDIYRLRKPGVGQP